MNDDQGDDNASPVVDVLELPEDTVDRMRSMYEAPLLQAHIQQPFFASINNVRVNVPFLVSENIAADLLLLPLDKFDICEHTIILEPVRKLGWA
jgi:hypothetical protein